MEMSIKSILVAADLGPNTGHVLDHALDLAQKYQAKVHVIYGIDVAKFTPQSTAELYLAPIKLEDSIENLLREEESHIRGQLQNICHERLVNLKVDESRLAGIDIERKPPKQAILDAASRYRADLIVMGAQQQPGANDTRLGPVTMKVLNRATVPVYVVKRGGIQG